MILQLIKFFLTEAGITSELENNPTIYNYFLLKSEDNPSGIVKEKIRNWL